MEEDKELVKKRETIIYEEGLIQQGFSNINASVKMNTTILRNVKGLE